MFFRKYKEKEKYEENSPDDPNQRFLKKQTVAVIIRYNGIYVLQSTFQYMYIVHTSAFDKLEKKEFFI